MARKLLLAASALGLWAASGAAWASGDSSCYASWKLSTKDRDCASRAMLAPGNDTRVNLLFLLRNRAGLGMTGLAHPEQGWDYEGFGQTFLSWRQLRTSLYPVKGDADETKQPDYSGSRCASLASGTPAFLGAMAGSRGLPAAERDNLATARTRLDHICANDLEAAAAWPGNIVSAPGKAFLGYLQASDAFYAGRWDEARSGFAALGRAKEPWVAETAAYMLARVDLNAAIVNAFDQYGWFQGQEKIDHAAVDRAGAALAAYLKSWPQGRFSVSAQGLQRRALWLNGERDALAREYDRLLGAASGSGEQAVLLVEEIDNKLLFPQGEQASAAVQGPLLLAAQDLLQMRDERGDDGSGDAPKLTVAALDAQRASFSAQPELYDFLRASHAFYVAKDMKQVLQLIPDDARKPAYSPLAFSRQVLRGMALAALGDRNEAGFWLELIGGAAALWQRPTVELALAMNYERHGKLAAVFAKDSPITDSDIRMILLANSAGPELLRAQAQDRSRPATERNVALYALLDKQLSQGDYAGFAASQKLAVPKLEGDNNPVLASNAAQQIPNFVGGTWADGYPCPALIETARRLAANPMNVPARLCLGEFWRLNGFDPYEYDHSIPAKDELGGGAHLFPGTPTTRGPIYAAIIADPRAPANDKAYALYRAINCYGPNGNNGCGGSDVEEAQRRTWFRRLKRDYPNSEWARKQRIFW